MNVAGIPSKERPAYPEFICNPVMDAISREPIHLCDFYIEQSFDLSADIFEGEVLAS
jgi:hypothetical protein